jgi:L-histidine N-alpha-methyltransferase
MTAARVEIVQGASPQDAVLEFAQAVVLGLSDRPRWTPARFLYDADGSRLFDKITDTPEYYLTRIEADLLEEHATAIARFTGPRTVVELGSGSARKTERLLSAYTRHYGPVRYVPVDVSEDALQRSATSLTRRNPALSIRGLHGTYDAALQELAPLSPVLLLFLGSTVGNLNQTEALGFWRQVSGSLRAGDFVLLGVDLVKDAAVIEAAYNDAAGWSAAFTRNLFARMNRELDAGLDLDAIQHEAIYRPDWRRVEIYARFQRRQTLNVRPLDHELVLETGARIMTEISRKFDLADLGPYLESLGFEVVHAFTDPRSWYALLLLRRGRET